MKQILLPAVVLAFCLTAPAGSFGASIELRILGTTSGTGESTTISVPSSGAGDGEIQFGSTNTSQPSPSTGKGVRLLSNNGARFVATLRAIPSLVGFSSADIQIKRTDAASSVPSERLRWAAGNSTDWRLSTPGTIIGGVNQTLAASAISGSTNTHEFALELKDTDVPTNKSLSVQYTITGNP